MAGELYCPHCYKQINDKELLFFKPSCGDKLPPPAPSVLQKLGIGGTLPGVSCTRNNKSTCKICDRILTFRACPICKGSISANRKGKPLIIAIAGTTGSGKSSYIHAAIDQLRKLSEICGWTIMEQESGSSKNSMYLIRKRKSDKGSLIVFAEITEEKLSPALMAALSGVVCLVDPLQVEALRHELKATNIVLPPLNVTEPHRILARLERVCPAIPLAVTVSKLDTLACPDINYTGRWRLKTNERLVCRDSSYRGTLDQEEMETVSCEMESWVAAADVRIMEACKAFTRKLFFGISTKEPTLRVEDPLLWILSQNKALGIK